MGGLRSGQRRTSSIVEQSLCLGVIHGMFAVHSGSGWSHQSSQSRFNYKTLEGIESHGDIEVQLSTVFIIQALTAITTFVIQTSCPQDPK